MNQNENRLGEVISVSGAGLSALLDAAADLPGRESGQGAPLGAHLGALVKIKTPSSLVYGLISSLALEGAPGCAGAPVIRIELMGEAVLTGSGEPAAKAARFGRGVSVYPRLGQAVFATQAADLALVYAKPGADSARIGALHQDASITAHVGLDALLGEHFAILGATGSGKSCALAVILRAVLGKLPNGHVVLLDPHGEYAHSFGQAALTLSSADLQLPYWFLNFEELTAALCSVEPGRRQVEAGILREAVVAAKRDQAGPETAVNPTVDTPTPYRLARLLELLREGMGKLDNPESAAPYLRLIGRIDGLRRDARFAFMFSGLIMHDILAEVLGKILRIPARGKPITIIDLAGTPSEIVDVVVSLLCRMIFDFSLWSQSRERLPVLVVCEEAHRYVPRRASDDATVFGPSRKAIERIAKEGRKYGVGLGLVTQRPSEISETILSQCNTLFALRLASDQDQHFVRRALPEAAAGLLAGLPSLATQEAIVMGQGVSLPMRIRFDDLDPNARPKSRSVGFCQAWREDAGDQAGIAETINRWRGQKM